MTYDFEAAPGISPNPPASNNCSASNITSDGTIEYPGSWFSGWLDFDNGWDGPAENGSGGRHFQFTINATGKTVNYLHTKSFHNDSLSLNVSVWYSFDGAAWTKVPGSNYTQPTTATLVKTIDLSTAPLANQPLVYIRIHAWGANFWTAQWVYDYIMISGSALAPTTVTTQTTQTTQTSTTQTSTSTTNCVATPGVISITSSAALDGHITQGQAPVTGSTTIKVGGIVVLITTTATRGFLSFDISLPANFVPTSANLKLTQVASGGFSVLVDHVNYGPTLDSADFSGATVYMTDFATILNGNGLKTVNASAQVLNDISAGRTRSQFRLKHNGALVLATSSFNSGDTNVNPPLLEISGFYCNAPATTTTTLCTSGTIINTYNETSPVNDIVVSPNARYIYSASNSATLRKFDIDSPGAPIDSFTHSNSVLSVDISPNGLWLLSGNDNGSAILWDLAISPPAALRTYTVGSLDLHDVVFAPDATDFGTAMEDDRGILWDANVANLQVLSYDDLTFGHTLRVKAIAFTPDGNEAYTASFDNTIKEWDKHLGTYTRTYNDTSQINAMVMSPIGDVFAVASNLNIHVWRTGDNSAFVENYAWHPTTVVSIDISNDGRYLLSGDSGGNIALWDRNLGSGSAPIKTYSAAGVASAVKFVPGRTSFLTGHSNNNIYLWCR